MKNEKSITLDDIERILLSASLDDGLMREFEDDEDYWSNAWMLIGSTVFNSKLQSLQTLSSFKLVYGLYLYLLYQKTNAIEALDKATQLCNFYALLCCYHQFAEKVTHYFDDNRLSDKHLMELRTTMKNSFCYLTNLILHYGTVGHVLAAKLYFTYAQILISRSGDEDMIRACFLTIKKNLLDAKKKILSSAAAITNVRIMLNSSNNEFLSKSLPLDVESITSYEKFISYYYNGP